MKLLIFKNWYRLAIATACLLFALGSLIFALKYNSAKAGTRPSLPTTKIHETNYWVVSCGNNIYEVSYNAFLEKYEFKVIGPLQDY
ncbi:MAG: hypothetical protein QM791_21560 [Ferruginibacter sp.]